jgi:stage II sporulation protein AA (anti-sigma F factor antagonist)
MGYTWYLEGVSPYFSKKFWRMIVLQIKLSYKGNTLIAKISGEIDHHSADYIRQKIDGETIKSTIKNLIFDFTQLSFMDSSGIGIIMGRYKNISRLNGKTAVVTSSSQIDRMLRMCGVQKFMNIYSNLDDAVKDFLN